MSRSRRATPGSPLAPPVLVAVEQLRLPVPGGIGTAARGLLLGLAQFAPQTRWGVVLYASAPAGRAVSAPQDDPLWAFDLPILISPYPSWMATRLWERGFGGPKEALSLVHATSFHYPPSAAPLVSTVHDLLWRHVPTAYTAHGRRWHEAALGRVARSAGAFVVPSTEVADDLRDAVGDTREIEVIPWGSDHLEPPDDAAADAVLEGLGVEGPILLSVSTIEPRKNLDRLIEAYGRARTEIPDAPTLLVVGPSGWGNGPVAAEGVVMAGKVTPPVLSALYRRAVAFVYVPLAEGYGLPVLEAMVTRTPVVSSPVPAASGATLLVDPFDPDSIASGITTVCLDTAVRDALIARGNDLARSRTWAHVARRHVDLWRRLGAELPSP